MYNLTPEKALIFRIVHAGNMPWLLDNGLTCPNSTQYACNYVNIGHKDIISKRNTKNIPISPFGTLSDYIPFYFTPFSMMLYNILTGYNVVQQSHENILILVTSLYKLKELKIPFLFTDSHAYTINARYFDDLDNLQEIDWSLLQNRNFSRDLNDPGKTDRYQAEALIHQYLPIGALQGIVCYTEDIKKKLQANCSTKNLKIQIEALPTWYFEK